MKIKGQTRKLAVGCSKHCFEIVDKTNRFSSNPYFEAADETDQVSNIYLGKAMLTWFEEILEEYKLSFRKGAYNESLSACKYRDL